MSRKAAWEIGKELIRKDFFPLFDRGMTAAEDMLMCILLQFLITGFNCWQVGKSSVTCNI